MRILGYTRVSTQEQATEGVSLAAQEEKLKAYCSLYGHELVEVVVDAGQSAKSLDRPGLVLALQGLKDGLADGLLIAKLDRLTRSVRDLGTLLEGPFRRAALISVAEQFDTASAAGRLVLNVIASVSQWEREANGERTSAALQYKKSQGQKLGPPAHEDPLILARMKELRAKRMTYRAIAAALAAEGYCTQKGGAWHAMTVQRMLTREGVA